MRWFLKALVGREGQVASTNVCQGKKKRKEERKLASP